MPEYNLLRINALAPRLPKIRRPASREKINRQSTAAIDEFNQRQTMRCVETRPHWTALGGSAGPVGGDRYATTTARIEKAIQHPQPTIQISAYLAFEYGRQHDIERLVTRLESILNVAALNEHWNYQDPNPMKPKTRMLASIIVEQWLSPAKYWRERESGIKPIVSSFSMVMGCNNRTWHTAWKHRFEQHRLVPVQWYEEGRFTMEGVSCVSLTA